MFVVHVHVHVKRDKIEEFIQATRENAKASLKEPGVIRFDVFQQEEGADFFILEEIYKTQADSGAHKDTPHYKKWKNTVEDMMSEPRRSYRLKSIFPGDGA
jgi:quinol monooxygenase YgiN